MYADNMALPAAIDQYLLPAGPTITYTVPAAAGLLLWAHVGTDG